MTMYLTVAKNSCNVLGILPEPLFPISIEI